MNTKYIISLAAFSLFFVACGDDKGSDSDDGESSAVEYSSGEVPLSGTSSIPLSSGQVPSSNSNLSSAPLSSGAEPLSSAAEQSSSAIGKLSIDVSQGYKQIVGVMHAEPAFAGPVTVTGTAYVNGRVADQADASVTFGYRWSDYVVKGGASTSDVPLSGDPSLDARLVVDDFACEGTYLAVITLTDGTTSVTDTASYSNVQWGSGDACP